MSVTAGDPRARVVPLRRWLISPGNQYKAIGALLGVLAVSSSALLLLHG